MLFHHPVIVERNIANPLFTGLYKSAFYLRGAFLSSRRSHQLFYLFEGAPKHTPTKQAG